MYLFQFKDAILPLLILKINLVGFISYASGAEGNIVPYSMWHKAVISHCTGLLKLQYILDYIDS